MNKILAIAKLTRIEHSLMLVVAVVAAELIAGGIPILLPFALSIITPILISMGAFAINDYFDVNADRANKRTERPIVSGAISKRGAYNVAVACLVLGAFASLFINFYVFAIAVVFSLLSYLYSWKLKDMLLIGNVYVAFATVIPFLYGDFVVSTQLNEVIVLISFVVFLGTLAREVHGMIRDRAGDQQARRSHNLVYHIGVKSSAYFALVLYAESIAFSLFIFFYELPFRYNAVYIVPIVFVCLAFLYIAIGYTSKSSRGFFDFSRNLSLGAMALTLLTYLIATLIYIPI